MPKNKKKQKPEKREKNQKQKGIDREVDQELCPLDGSRQPDLLHWGKTSTVQGALRKRLDIQLIKMEPIYQIECRDPVIDTAETWPRIIWTKLYFQICNGLRHFALIWKIRQLRCRIFMEHTVRLTMALSRARSQWLSVERFKPQSL